MFKWFNQFLVGLVAFCQLGLFTASAQELDSIWLSKNGISQPNILATHPFGLLFFTLPHNFKMSPEKGHLKVSLSSGNIWGQPVDVFVPSDQADRDLLGQIPFFDRIFSFDPTASPSEFYSIQYDGVVKDFRLSYSFQLGAKDGFRIGARSFLLTEGRFPFSIFTGDQFIEFFHRQIAGGDDPFGRKFRGLDQAGFAYLDRTGKSMRISAGEFVLSGVELAYYHYPEIFTRHKIHMNLGIHMGANLSKYNRSFDLGASVAGMKRFLMANKDLFQVGLGFNFLRRSLATFSADQTDLGTSNFIGSMEAHLEYAFKNSTSGVHSIGLNYRIQSPYNSPMEDDYYVPFSPDRIARWHEAAGHLYKFPSYWSLIYSFTKSVEFSIYIQQDMLVNNAPDFQTGVQLAIPLNRK